MEQDLGVKWFNTVFYPQRKTARAVRYEDGVLPRLRENEINLFTPWGPRYHWRERGTQIRPTDKEIVVLRFLSRILGEWQENMPEKKFTWLFLGADLYGTRINGLPEEPVGAYFENLRRWLAEILPLAKFRLWSEFDQEAGLLREGIRNDLHQRLSLPIINQARKTAVVMSGGAAEAYLTERLTEADLIETLYRPIKVSAVGRHKDEMVDGNLPRLYFLPEPLWAPWL
ncbi:MAG: hypothetical protein AAB486_01250 [Patescibacteria group bacterium]